MIKFIKYRCLIIDLAAVRARHIVAALVAVGFALCGAVEVSSSVALLANQKDNHAIIDTSWHCEMLVNISSRNRTEDFEVILMEVRNFIKYFFYFAEEHLFLQKGITLSSYHPKNAQNL